MTAAILASLLVLWMAAAYVSCQTVDTSSGQVQGFQSSGVIQFLGIPFAETPTGARRFAKPVRKTRMPGIYNATFFRPSCSQIQLVIPRSNTDEDCLFLNIFSPLDASKNNLKDVMVWVHGGSYLQGSSVDFFGGLLAQRGGVVVVTINYRLGAFGFFSTGDENAVGNLGLWDQTMALQWVKLNIPAFGGDPEKITIFGESAGSAAVTQLAISPFAQTLFRGVIAESGTAHAQWSHYDDPLTPARQLGRRLGCPTGNNKALVECMRRVSEDQILHSQTKLSQNPAFLPIYGTDFIPFSPQQLASTHMNSSIAKRFAELDFIIGQNSDESALFFKFLMEGVDDLTGISQAVFEKGLMDTASALSPNDKDLGVKLLQPLKFVYTDWSKMVDGVSRAKSMLKVLSDTIFTVSIVHFARAHAFLTEQKASSASVGKTFMYLFNQRGSWSAEKQPWRTGADHADEIPFVFGYLYPGLRPNMTDAEETLSVRMMQYWSNFAKTGNPNQPLGGAGLVQWPSYTTDTQKYLRLDTDLSENSIQSYVYNERVEFWSDYIPKQIQIYASEPKPVIC